VAAVRNVAAIGLWFRIDPTTPHYVLDAVDDDDLFQVAEAAKSHILMTGASAVAGFWARAIGGRRSGDWPTVQTGNQSGNQEHVVTVGDEGGPAIVLPGSCSEATRHQVAEFERGVKRLIVAGGEASGAVINALAIHAVRIGTEIAPGVPRVTSLGFEPMSLALKSGNFGGPRFSLDALELTR